MKKKVISGICLVMVMLLLVVPTTFAAIDFNPIHVISSEQGDIITDSISNVFSILLGNNVKVQHSIFGTTIVMGNKVDIDSDIDGDLIVLGSNITLSGKVEGNLYAAGDGLSINSSILKDAFIFGNNLALEKGSLIGRDALLFGSTVNAFGEIKRDVVAYARSYKLYGNVGRDMSVSAEEIYVADGSKIVGGFTYQSKNDALINSGANIEGNVQKYGVEDAKPMKTPSPFKFLFDILFTLGVAVVFWAVSLLVAPRLSEKFASMLAQKPGKAAGFGAIALVTVPIASIVLLFTVVGIPLSLILGVTYAVSLYLAFYISAGTFGIVMFKNVFKLGDLHKNIWYILAGVFVVKLLTMIPFVGWIISLATVIFGLGLFLLLLISQRGKQA